MFKKVYIAGMPEAQKDNRARIQELGNLIREGGFEITGRGKFEIIYRGEGGTSCKGGSYWSPSAEWAKQFTQTGRIEEVKKAFIKSDDIYTAKELPYAGNPDAIDKAVAHAKNKGFKAVRLSEGPNEPQSVYVFDQTALKSVSAMEGVMETLTPKREPWQMTKEEFAKTAVALPDRKDFVKAWLKDNEEIPELVKPGFNYIEQRNGSLLVFGNQSGQAIGIISFRQDAVEHIAVSDRYKNKGIATQLLEESRKYGVRRITGQVSPEVAGIVHRFTVRTAFLEGKPVPPHVLREYPDLMAKAEKQKWRRTI
jgi:GNAT superfamily N-acetyltransferase